MAEHLAELKKKGGGSSLLLSSGTFTISDSSAVSVNCGFKPKKICAYNILATGHYMTISYDEDVSTTTYARTYARNNTPSSSASASITSGDNTINSIDSNGFTLKASLVTGTWNYFAIG